MRTCDRCGAEPARKIRLNIFPWMKKCVILCREHEADVPELLAELREQLTTRGR